MGSGCGGDSMPCLYAGGFITVSWFPWVEYIRMDSLSWVSGQDSLFQDVCFEERRVYIVMECRLRPWFR